MKPFVLGLRLRQMSNDVKLNMPDSDSLQFRSSKGILTLFFSHASSHKHRRGFKVEITIIGFLSFIPHTAQKHQSIAFIL